MGNSFRKLSKLDLNDFNVEHCFTDFGTIFHNLGPTTAKDESYNVCALLELEVLSEGT